MQSTLDVVNSMLVQIGQTAMSSLQLNHPDVRSALRIVDDINTEVQSREWWYNTETWELEPQPDGTVLLPGNTLAIITGNNDLVKRGRKLYDLARHSFDFSEETSVTVDVISAWDLEDVPPTMYTYIVAKCRHRMQVSFEFDVRKVDSLSTEINEAYHYVQRQHVAATQPNSTSQQTAAQVLQNISTTR